MPMEISGVGEHLFIFFVALNHARIKKDLGLNPIKNFSIE